MITVSVFGEPGFGGEGLESEGSQLQVGLSEQRNSLSLELWGEVHESPVRVHHGTSGSLSLGLALGQ